MSFILSHAASRAQAQSQPRAKAIQNHRRQASASSSSHGPIRPRSPNPAGAAEYRPPRARPTARPCVLWVHDEAFSKEPVIIGSQVFPKGALRKGDLIQLVAIRPQKQQQQQRSASGNNESSPIERPGVNPIDREFTASNAGDSITKTSTVSQDQRDLDHEKKYIFVLRDAEGSKQPNLQVSISAHIAGIFGFQKWSHVMVSVVDKAVNSASHVEITFKDQYLTRSDMWRLTATELNERTVYKGQKLLFLGSIKGTVKEIYVRGEKSRSALFTSSTKPIFRSQSARFIIFIQMSKEMWEFDTEGKGEIIFDRVVNGFLPELFSKWERIQARHLVSIVLFTRMEYEGPATVDTDSDGEEIPRPSSPQQSADGRFFRDFFKVVVSNMASGDWTAILYELKREFRVFLRDTLTRPVKIPLSVDGEEYFEISGQPTAAVHGNVLEAINLATSQFAQDHIDRDLIRTGISVVMITPGVGYFEVDYNMLKQTTEALVQNGIGIDLVCLSRMPLHSVPLFKYRNPQVFKPASGNGTKANSLATSPSKNMSLYGSYSSRFNLMSRASDLSTSPRTPRSTGPVPGQYSFAVPHWIDVSFWSEAVDRRQRKDENESRKANRGDFVPRCRMYELQMMGVMENEISNISIPFLRLNPFYAQIPEPDSPDSDIAESSAASSKKLNQYAWMDEHDEWVFRPVSEFNRHLRRKKAKAVREEERQLNQKLQADERRYGNSYKSTRNSPGDGTAYLDRKMRQRADRSSAKVGLLPVTPAKTSRQISFGAKGWFSNSAKATASTGGINVGRVQMGALSRTGSQQVVSTEDPKTPKEDSKSEADERSIAEESDGSASRPIAIRSAAKDAARRNTSLAAFGALFDTGVKDKQDLEKLDRLQTLTRPAEDPDLAKAIATQFLRPESALAPWLTILNPSNPEEGRDLSDHFRRWQHVFPRPLHASTVKWKSLCSPASLPITTEYFPTAEQFRDEYEEAPYVITQNDDDDLDENPRGNKELMQELIALRLAQGFQLVIGAAVAEATGRPSLKVIDVWSSKNVLEEGAMVFMSKGNSIHQLLCVGSYEVEVKRFERKAAMSTATSLSAKAPDDMDVIHYRPYIQSALCTEYKTRDVVFNAASEGYKWNTIDSFVAGYTDQFTDQLRFWRARFVLIPTENIQDPDKDQSPIHEDNPEELRIEGIRRLTQIWQRHRWISPEERRYVPRKKRLHNPLDVRYRTRDPSVVLTAELDALPLIDEPMARKSQILSDADLLERSVSLLELARLVQADSGVRMQDRRWHLRLHYNCFIGSEMVTWLLEHFKDIDSRDEAVEFGNELMNRSLFLHVEGRHQFRDGNYFYQLANDYASPRPASRAGWFGTIRGLPPTPTLRPDTGMERPLSGEKPPLLDLNTPTPPPVRKPKVWLSKSIKFDVDPRHRSYRPEIITLHYDTLHNPENCFHIRIEWLNVTAKFIEDAMISWGVTAEKYGLNLVEAPIAESCSAEELQPFRAPVAVRLCLPPPAPKPQILDPTSAVPHEIIDDLYYHKLILKKFNFVLDLEPKSAFPSDVDVRYSWGEPNYEHVQYIHRSGAAFVQIGDEGEFMLLANRLYNCRLGTHQSKQLNVAPTHIEDIKGSLQAFCGSVEALQAFYQANA